MYAHHRDLLVLTHSVPTRRASELVSEVIVTGARASAPALEPASPVTTISADDAERSAAPPVAGSSVASRLPPPRPYPRPQPQPQSGILTAGEHDDLQIGRAHV